MNHQIQIKRSSSLSPPNQDWTQRKWQRIWSFVFWFLWWIGLRWLKRPRSAPKCDSFWTSTVRLLTTWTFYVSWSQKLDRKRGGYGLTKAKMSSCLIKILGIATDNPRATKLTNWNKNDGRFSSLAVQVRVVVLGFWFSWVCSFFFGLSWVCSLFDIDTVVLLCQQLIVQSRKQDVSTSGLTVKTLDEHLDMLAHSADKQARLSTLIGELRHEEIQWVIAIIVKGNTCFRLSF